MKRMRMKNRALSNPHGITLVEMMISVLIFSFISLGLAAILLAGQKYWSVNDIQIRHQQELRKSLEAMIYDLRQTSGSFCSVDADSSPDTSITFPVPQTVTNGTIVWNANNITYALNGTTLQKTQAGVTNVISQDIRSLQFQRDAADPDILHVSVTAGTPLISPAQFEATYGETYDYSKLKDIEKMELTITFEIQMRN